MAEAADLALADDQVLVRRGYSDCIDVFRRDNRPPD